MLREIKLVGVFEYIGRGTLTKVHRETTLGMLGMLLTDALNTARHLNKLPPSRRTILGHPLPARHLHKSALPGHHYK